MITKFKIYEQLDEGTPMYGDYVICLEQESGDDEFDNFLLNCIGEIVGYSEGSYDYIIKYNDIPNQFLFYFGSNGTNYRLCRPMKKSEILHWSENKEDLEPFIQSNKYNL